MAYEPGNVEIWLTLATGALADSYYRSFVHGMDLHGSERVLDFGSGAGNVAVHLARALRRGGGRLTCLDVSRRWMEVARNRLHRFEHVTYALGDITGLGVPDAAFDAVVCHFVLHQLPPAQLPVVGRQWARVMSPGARLFIREPLAHIPESDVRNALARASLREVSAAITAVRTQGKVFEGVYTR